MIVKEYDGQQRLLEIDNAHSAGCGAPPSIDAEDKHVSYFENALGEQWLFVGDSKTGKATIYGGDAGWEPFHVSQERPCPANLVVGDAERQWIISCVMAVSNGRYEPIAAAFARDYLPARFIELLEGRRPGADNGNAPPSAD